MRRSVKILWITTLGRMSIFLLMLLLINFRLIGNVISIESLENPGSVLASEIIAEDGAVLGRYCQINCFYSSYDAISKDVINGLLATEDLRFYYLSGIEASNISNIPFYLIIGKAKNGSGTITQQLARGLLASDAGVYVAGNIIERTFQKMQEWLLTIKLERKFAKQEIIALYLNTVSFGDEIEGIENAARTFFSKDAGHLSLDEAATLIGMLRGKNLYNPCRNLNLSLLRRNVVIDLMQKNEFITQAEAEEAKSKPIILRYSEVDCNKGLAPYFRDVLRDELKAWCKVHKKADGIEYNLYQDGLRIYTVVNPGKDTILIPNDSVPKSIYVICIKDRYGNILQRVDKNVIGEANRNKGKLSRNK
ncbi:transglycosylase domain-containing protein [Chitinophaga filiformis]|uniref:Transglycosylase n=1 Tax=Chitinophaga filiformis TaxID=104663 RepID=A0A1G7N909_CHIFI|nr:transglycosylase domain-containing protein [Chitinophaga filiformis]SDF70426.1 Transglycosylase [Chitinophaga filiformis]